MVWISPISILSSIELLNDDDYIIAIIMNGSILINNNLKWAGQAESNK